MVMFWSVENDGLAFKDVRIVGIRQEAGTEFVRNYTCLHHRGIEQIAAEDDKTAFSINGLSKGAMTS